MTTGIWVRLMHRNHILRDIVEPCAWEDWQTALGEACRKMDQPRPIVLRKHETDFENFSQTRFLPDSFLESVHFDRMEVEFIDPEKKKGLNEEYL